MHLSVISVPSEAAAAAIIRSLAGGADFATVAKGSSDDVTASVGGDLGYVTRAELNPELSGVAGPLAKWRQPRCGATANGSS